MDSDIFAAAAILRSHLKNVQVGVILGSGLGAAAQQVADAGGLVVPFAQLPGMPVPKVVGHEGRLVIGTGRFEGAVLIQGRVHLYEGHPIESLTFATRLLAELGMQHLVVSNAAGGIEEGYQPGDLMLINGHWTLCDVQHRSVTVDAGSSLTMAPFAGRNLDGQFLWNRQLLQLAENLPSSLNIHKGSYAMMSGPNYETPAEIRMLRSLGCQAVGMSTVPEALAAARQLVNVLGISCITNVAAGLSDQPLDHSEVSETAGSVETEFVDWLFRLLDKLLDTGGRRSQRQLASNDQNNES